MSEQMPGQLSKLTGAAEWRGKIALCKTVRRLPTQLLYVQLLFLLGLYVALPRKKSYDPARWAFGVRGHKNRKPCF